MRNMVDINRMVATKNFLNDLSMLMIYFEWCTSIFNVVDNGYGDDDDDDDDDIAGCLYLTMTMTITKRLLF